MIGLPFLKISRFIYVKTEQARDNYSLLNRSTCLPFLIIAIVIVFNIAHSSIWWITSVWDKALYVNACLYPNNNTIIAIQEQEARGTYVIIVTIIRTVI